MLADLVEVAAMLIDISASAGDTEKIANSTAKTQLPPAGFEPATLGLGNRCQKGANAIAAKASETLLMRPDCALTKAAGEPDPDLAFIVDHWNSLPDSSRAAMLLVARASLPRPP